MGLINDNIGDPGIRFNEAFDQELPAKARAIDKAFKNLQKVAEAEFQDRLLDFVIGTSNIL